MSVFGKTASESRGLENALRLIAYAERQLEAGGGVREMKPFLDEAKDILRALKHSAGRGVHHNPPLTVFGMNPPLRVRSSAGTFEEEAARPRLKIWVAGQIGKNVHDIRYTHADTGEDFEHIFETGKTRALAVEGQGIRRSVLLTGPDDIWDNY